MKSMYENWKKEPFLLRSIQVIGSILGIIMFFIFLSSDDVRISTVNTFTSLLRNKWAIWIVFGLLSSYVYIGLKAYLRIKYEKEI